MLSERERRDRVKKQRSDRKDSDRKKMHYLFSLLVALGYSSISQTGKNNQFPKKSSSEKIDPAMTNK